MVFFEYIFILFKLFLLVLYCLNFGDNKIGMLVTVLYWSLKLSISSFSYVMKIFLVCLYRHDNGVKFRESDTSLFSSSLNNDVSKMFAFEFKFIILLFPLLFSNVVKLLPFVFIIDSL